MRGILILYFMGINLVTFLLYGVDKWKARKGRGIECACDGGLSHILGFGVTGHGKGVYGK